MRGMSALSLARRGGAQAACSVSDTETVLPAAVWKHSRNTVGVPQTACTQYSSQQLTRVGVGCDGVSLQSAAPRVLSTRMSSMYK